MRDYLVGRLKCDVKNPKPDRRYNRNCNALEVWLKGSLWTLIPICENTCEILRTKGTDGQICSDESGFDLIKANLEIVEEMNISEIKQEALAYKKELLNASDKLNKVTDVKGAIASGLSDLNEDILGDDKSTPETSKDTPKAAPKPEKVTFEKKKKKEDNIDV